MPVYQFKALSDGGETLVGEEAAESSEALSDHLNRKGLYVQSIHQKRQVSLSFSKRKKVSDEKFLLFTLELTTLLKAGLTLTEALKLTADRPSQQHMSRVITHCIDSIKSGQAFSTACEQHQEIFEELFISSVKTGEKTGDFVNVFKRYQNFVKRRIALRKKITQAMLYPVFLLITLFLVLIGLFVFVLPRFVAMYTDFNTELPLPTRILMDIVDRSPVIMAVAAAVLFALWMLQNTWKKTEEGKIRLAMIRERLPLLGELAGKIAIAQISRTFASLLSSGMTLVDTMKTTVATIPNRAYAKRLDEASRLVIEGQGLSSALNRGGFFPHTVIKMLEAGEASGNVEEFLDEIAEYYEESIDYTLTRIMSLVEPAFMLLIGIFVGGIILVMYLPIFSISNMIQ